MHEHDIPLLEGVPDLLERLVDLVGEDAGAGLLVREIEDDTVRVAVLERDPLDTGGVWPPQVLDGVTCVPTWSFCEIM